MTVRELIALGERELAGRSATPRLDAELLLASLRGGNRAALLRDADDSVAEGVQARFAALLARRAHGEPVAYLVGEREFWSLRLRVSPAVLDPRPDTETLVEQALEAIAGIRSPRILDLGTGSGAVALALATERPDAWVVATDRSSAALAVAAGNVAAIAPGRVRLACMDWMTALRSEPVFDLIVSNPPYLAAGDPHLPSLAAEPRCALVAGDDAMACLREIIREAPQRLRAGGSLWLEHGHDQGAAVRAALAAAGFARIATRRDLAGHERVSGGFRP